jgi:hypothetical protein
MRSAAGSSTMGAAIFINIMEKMEKVEKVRFG